MSNSIFCPNCGMLKSNCTCGHSNNEVSSSNGDSVDLFSFQKPRSSSILDDEIPEVYSIEDHRLDEDTVSYLQGKYPHIETDIIENFSENSNFKKFIFIEHSYFSIFSVDFFSEISNL